jgi:hypothetical protein
MTDFYGFTNKELDRESLAADLRESGEYWSQYVFGKKLLIAADEIDRLRSIIESIVMIRRFDTDPQDYTSLIEDEVGAWASYDEIEDVVKGL